MVDVPIKNGDFPIQMMIYSWCIHRKWVFLLKNVTHRPLASLGDDRGKNRAHQLQWPVVCGAEKEHKVWPFEAGWFTKVHHIFGVAKLLHIYCSYSNIPWYSHFSAKLLECVVSRFDHMLNDWMGYECVGISWDIDITWYN